jgi:hypothetical protein
VKCNSSFVLLNNSISFGIPFRDLYSSPSIIRIMKSRRMRWAVHVARIGEKRNAYRLLVGKPEGKRPLRRPRRRWVDNIKMDGRSRVNWSGSG